MLNEKDFEDWGNQLDIDGEYVCSVCGKRVDLREFQTELQVEEFSISGKCEKCQE